MSDAAPRLSSVTGLCSTNANSHSPSGLVIDIDGTLFGRSERVSPRLSKAIAHAKQVVPVALASGRGVEEVSAIARGVGLHGWHIGDNGAALIDSVTNEVRCEAHLPQDLAHQILEAAISAGVHCFSSGGGKIRYCSEEIDSRAVTLITIRADDPNELDEWQDRFVSDRLAAVRSVGSSGEHYINFTGSGIDKGRGIRVLSRLLHFELGTVVAIGDGLNDIPMFNAVGVPIALANAPDQVKRKAIAVVDSVDRDGAAQAIERYVLKGADY